MDLLVPLAKESVLRKVEDRVRRLDRTYVVRWVAGDMWIVDSLAMKYGREARAMKATVLETFDAITPDDLLAACRRARPDLADLWGTPEARTKIEAEWRRGRALVEKL